MAFVPQQGSYFESLSRFPGRTMAKRASADPAGADPRGFAEASVGSDASAPLLPGSVETSSPGREERELTREGVAGDATVVGSSKRTDWERGPRESSAKGIDAGMGSVARREQGGEAQGPLQLSLMALLALVTGCIPLLTRKCVGPDVSITSQVLACEVLKVLLSSSAILASGAPLSHFCGWSFTRAIAAASIPSAIYAVQNTLLQVSIRHLDSVTFTLLYQTRLISTALCNHLFLNRAQTRRQMLALLLVLLAAVLLSLPAGTQQTCTATPSTSNNGMSNGMSNTASKATSDSPLGYTQTPPDEASASSNTQSNVPLGYTQNASTPSGVPSATSSSMWHDQSQEGSCPSALPPWLSGTLALGVVPVLLASLTSGLSSAYCQWLLQVRVQLWLLQDRGHNANVFSLELASTSILLLSLGRAAAGAPASAPKGGGFFHGWTALAMVPPVANAFAGILVGLVTKHAGGVSKGLAVIGGLLVAAVMHCVVEGTNLTIRVWMSLPLVAWGMYLYMGLGNHGPSNIPETEKQE